MRASLQGQHSLADESLKIKTKGMLQMTKTELMKKTMLARVRYSHRLNTCTAWVEECEDRETGELFNRLRSYNTIVAVQLDTMNGSTVFVYDYWSATTAQHITKYIRQVEPDQVIWLYGRSDRMIKESRHRPYPVVKMRINKIREQYERDWEDIITAETGE